MPVVRIDYDKKKVPSDAALAVSEAAQKIVSEVTGIEDVVVYTNDSEIKVKTHPIEIFVEMSAHKIENIDELMTTLKASFSAWKKENNFEVPINLTLTPMPWKIEIGI